MVFYSGGKNVYFKRIYIKLNLEIFLIFLFVVQRKAVQNLAAFCRAISIPALEAVLAETLQFHQCICPCIVYARLLLLLLSFMSVSSWEFGCKFCFFFFYYSRGYDESRTNNTQLFESAEISAMSRLSEPNFPTCWYLSLLGV